MWIELTNKNRTKLCINLSQVKRIDFGYYGDGRPYAVINHNSEDSFTVEEAKEVEAMRRFVEANRIV